MWRCGVSERGGTDRSRDNSPDMMTLLVGLFAVVVAAAVAFDWAGKLQWVLAIAAIAVGVVMLVSSTRSRRKR